MKFHICFCSGITNKLRPFRKVLITTKTKHFLDFLRKKIRKIRILIPQKFKFSKNLPYIKLLKNNHFLVWVCGLVVQHLGSICSTIKKEKNNQLYYHILITMTVIIFGYQVLVNNKKVTDSQ